MRALASLLPRFAVHGWSGSFSDDYSDDFEGTELSVRWLGCFFAVTFAKVSGR